MTETEEETRRVVRERYGQIATQGGDCCSSNCCQPDGETPSDHQSERLGYRDTDLSVAPAASNLGLGCGNPHLIARLREGETVLDLGGGGGFDCFLAARQVTSAGRVIGVDMTPEMVALARRNLADVAVDHVDFRLGEIEHLPVADGCVDVILSNCVVNLSPDKPAVFREAMRVLRPGGRLAISDVIATTPLPESLRRDLNAVASCLGGAATVPGITDMLSSIGFIDVQIERLAHSRKIVSAWDTPRGLHNYVASATIEGRKPS